MAFYPNAVVTTTDWLTTARTLIEAYVQVNSTVVDDDIRTCARVALLKLLTIRLRVHLSPAPDAQAHNLESETHLEVLVDSSTADATETALVDDLTLQLRRHSSRELDRIRAPLPLIDRYASSALGVDGWALIFWDHYVENTLGLLLGVYRAGIPARWIYALAKGDHTHRRD